MEASPAASVSESSGYFQVAIVVDFNDNARLFPLLADSFPLCLLPIANRPVLALLLDLLVANGVKEAFLSSPKDYCTALSSFLRTYEQRAAISIEIVAVGEGSMSGTGDSLRVLADRIHANDLLVLSTDFVSQLPLSSLLNLHREKAADATVLFAPPPLEETEKGSKVTLRHAKIDGEDQEFIALSSEGRLLLKRPAYEVEDVFSLHKHLLHTSASPLTLRTDLMDVGCYVLSKWILNTLRASSTSPSSSVASKFSSLRTDVLPYLVDRQNQSEAYLREHLPALFFQRKPLQELSQWLNVSSLSSSFSSLHPETRGSPLPPRISRLSSFSSQATAAEESKPADGNGTSADSLRCFAFVLSDKESSSELNICRRITSLHAYMALNKYSTYLFILTAVYCPSSSLINRVRDVLVGAAATSLAPWSRLQGYQKKEISVLGDKSTLGNKVTLKGCSVGRDCVIGDRSKLNNCIVMDGVIIGEG